MASWASAHNRPVYLGEFGSYEKADMDSRVRWTKCVADEAVAHGFSFTYWQFTYNLAVYDRAEKNLGKTVARCAHSAETIKLYRWRKK